LNESKKFFIYELPYGKIPYGNMINFKKIKNQPLNTFYQLTNVKEISLKYTSNRSNRNTVRGVQ